MKLTAKSMRVLAPLSILISSVASPAFAGNVEVLGLWNFSEKSGTFFDKSGNSTGAHNGVVGYEDQDAYKDLEGFEGVVKRNKGRAIFEGKPNSIVFIESDAQDGTFDATADIDYFRYTARFKLPYNVLTSTNDKGEVTFPSNATWNLMQKGFSPNTGGQWKMQIKNINGQAYLQCVIKDSPELQIEATNLELAIKPGKLHLATCAIDRRKNLLKAILTNQESGSGAVRSDPSDDARNLNGRLIEERKRGVIPANFMDIKPNDGDCDFFPNAFGGHVIIGNKPACPGGLKNLDSTDQFVGKIYNVKITRQTLD